ncbi:MAG: glycoside hydrolase family 127 protein [Bacteroidales bacterium]|nr:glycoside hydrolase family 127 protein [Bacteroidales bacterium]
MKRQYFLISATMLLVLLSSCFRQQIDYIKPEEPGIERITLLEGPWQDAMMLDQKYLKSLEPDRFLVHFRKVSGLPAEAIEYGGWESESRELRGHSAGHYLSAASRMYRLTGDSILMEKCRYLVQELKQCQEANGNGYLSAFPEEYLDRVEAVRPVWAPYYTLHKILAGLLDSYTYCEDEDGLSVALELSHYLYGRILPLGEEQFQRVLDKTEQGGMNDLFWNLYAVTGDTVCRELALSFYQKSYFDPMMAREDRLAGQHSNSLIPNVVGIAREYELTGDVTRKDMAEWFWSQVVDSRSYITGGTSNGEHWNTAPWHMDGELGAGAHESCCTYNMIKLSEQLWNWSGDVRYHEYMERALVNGILPTQNRETGMSMYYVSMAPGYYKTWGMPESSFWCCTGTGMENFARIAEYIYGVRDERIYINQFVASTLDYPEHGLKLTLRTDLPVGKSMSLEAETTGKTGLRLAVRIPSWTGSEYTVTINGRPLDSKPSPGSYLLIDREWNDGDKLEIEFVPSLWASNLPVRNRYVAFGYGPLVLAARFGEAEVDSALRYRYGPYDGKPADVADVDFNSADIARYIQAVDIRERHFTIQDINGKSIDLVPFIDIHNEYYSVYLPVDSGTIRLNNKRVDPSVH